MTMNDVAALPHVWPGIRIHVIDIVQPPGIGMAFMRDMDAHPTIVSTAQRAESAAAAAKKVRSVLCEAIMAISMRQVH
ncbi:hypothetical protein GCM10010981_26660 [Dyella nitratireducens]|uniref:Uncharacterized protein n=1 Tax=Dyella nitratireducens TaxID=1849580 RepID=A0ABQ1G443_9GAMM|nr:hypothetical protein GCM10010981_26660 [Dyella nitratireducens]GLQ40187.1 hypothetical protein GCM10007902_00360 [Dyella nitratireducens]